jgi:hypothetical protein
MKKLVGSDITGSYVFNPVAKTIVFSGLNLSANQFLLITNMTDNIIIFNFADASRGGFFNSNTQTLTLTYDTSSMSNTDVLQVFVDVPDTMGEAVHFLKRIMHMIKPLTIMTGAGSSRLNLDVNNIVAGTINTVSTVSTVSNQVNMAGINTFDLLKSGARTAYSVGIRNNLTF